MKYIFFSCWLAVSSFVAAAQDKPVLYPKLSQTIDSLYEADQRPMRAMMEHSVADSTSKRLIAAQFVNFARHQPVLEAIVRRYGYPGFRQVGEGSSNNFFTLVQHADKYPDFQQRMLRLMLPQVRQQNVNPSNYAYLTDRIALNAGRPQEYGTQLSYKAVGEAFPRNLRDPQRVNQRRKALGMPALEEYLQKANDVNRRMNTPASK